VLFRSAGAARNAGIAASSSEWIAFLDADDEWLPDKLARQWELMERHPALDWCCAAFFMEKGRGDPRTMVGRPRSGEYDFFDAENAGDFHVSTVTVLVRRSALRAAGGFDAELRRHQDWDMWWRLAYSSPKIGYVGQPLTIVHQDEDTDASMTKRLTAKKGRYLKLLLKKHARLSASTRQRAAFETLALELIRNAVLMAVFLGYKREARQLLEELDDLIPRLPGALLRSIVLTPLSERILRTGYAALQKAGLAETANRNWDYLRLANEERRRELTK
jgi:GT2 family glycosyltransferase